MGVVLEIHLVVAYLVLLLALTIGWVQMGRRVMVGVIGLQVLLGAILAATLRPPPAVFGHILLGLFAMGAYIVGSRIARRGASQLPLLMSALGLLFVLSAMWLGLRMAGAG